MAAFIDLLNEIYSITGRPDLVDKSKSALKAATLKLHGEDYYNKDIVEVGVQFDNLDYYQVLSCITLFSNYRNISYARKYDLTSSSPGAEFDIISVDKVFDEYALERTDIIYPAGVNLNFKSSTQFKAILLGYYSYPNVTELGYSSWIANIHMYAIIYEAVARLYKSIGLDQEAVFYTQSAIDEKQAVKATGLAIKGE